MNTQQLREQVRWITYQLRAKENTDKMKKVPCDKAGRDLRAWNKSENWISYDVATKTAKAYNAKHNHEAGAVGSMGVGVVMNGDGVVCIDIDGCLTPPATAGGEWGIAPHALAVLEQCAPTLIEISVSQKGLHIFGRLATPQHENKYHIDGHIIEVFSSGGKYIAWTGYNFYNTLGINHLKSNELAPIDDVINWLESNNAPPKKEQHDTPPTATPTTTQVVLQSVATSPRKSTPTADIEEAKAEWYREKFMQKLHTAMDVVRNATTGDKHKQRVRAGKIAGGALATMRQLGYEPMSKDSVVDALYNALPPQSNKKDEERAIEKGIEYGMELPIPLVEFDPSKAKGKRAKYSSDGAPPPTATHRAGGNVDSVATVGAGGDVATVGAIDIPEYDPIDATLSPMYHGHGYALTDIGNSRRMVEASRGNLLYNGDATKWLAWNATQWATLPDPLVMRYAKAVAEYISIEAKAVDPDNARAIIAHATRSQSLPRINAMIELAKAELYTDMGAFDNNPDYLPCINGVIDLQSGTLIEHERDMYHTKITNINYDPTATAPSWEKFIDTITGGNQEVATYLQMQVGYSLTGHIDQQCLFFLYGHGANGKSTFMNTIAKLAGEYHRKVDMDAILESDKSGGGANPFLVALVGMRMTSGSEFPAGRRINEALVKDLTGGDEITARGLYSNPFSFRPINKYWLMGNHKPRITGTDGGIWRRLVLIPFNHTIPESDRKPSSVIDAIFNEEMAGILAWAVRGAIAWYGHPQRASLPKPDVISEAITEYRTEEDTVQRFMMEQCDIDANLSCTAKDMLEAFHAWLSDQGERTNIWTQTRLTRELKRMDITQGGAQKSKYLGVRPRQKAE